MSTQTLQKFEFQGLEFVILTKEMDFSQFGNLFYDFYLDQIKLEMPFAICNGPVSADNFNYEVPLHIPKYCRGYAVKGIARRAFENSSFKEIYLPDTLLYIGGYAFQNCKELTKLHFPNELWGVEYYICRGCFRLEEIVINKVYEIGAQSLAEIYPTSNADAGKGNTNLKIKVGIAPIVYKINGDIKQTNATYVQSIIKYCYNCKTFFALPRCHSYLSQSTHMNWSKCSLTELGVTNSDYMSNRYNDTVYNVTLGQNYATFNNLPNITTVTFDYHCTKIDQLPMFYNCPKLNTIYIRDLPELTSTLTRASNMETDSLFGEGVDSSKITIYVDWSETDYPEHARLLKSLAGQATIRYKYKIKNEQADWDFIGFTFNGVHCVDDLHIYRVIDGDRYNMDIRQATKETTAPRTGHYGTYYFTEVTNSRTIAINFAFDGLGIEDIKKIQRTYLSEKAGDLIFDEYPYKVYKAKYTGELKLEYVPFADYHNKTVYKGTGTISFICYEPFASTRTDIRNMVDGRHFGYFKSFTPDEKDYHVEQWREKNALVPEYQNLIEGQNFGELPAPFIATLKGAAVKNTTITIAGNTITILEDANNVQWDSKNGIITGEVDGVRRAINHKGYTLSTLPVYKEIPPINYITTSANKANLSIDYQFWYY